jgi:hypothetical protein
MPYIDKERRTMASLPLTDAALTPGELNYQFTEVIKLYVQTHGLSYKTANDILGALEGAKLEFYRRVVVPYEEKKCRQNSDVYPEPWTRSR